MKICNICHKLSGTGQDHIDCVQRRAIELEAEDFKNSIPEKLNMSNVLNDLEQPSSSPIAGQDVQKGPSSKAGGALARGAYTGVREHDKGPRTPLADFFNILLGTRKEGKQWRKQNGAIHVGVNLIESRTRSCFYSARRSQPVPYR